MAGDIDRYSNPDEILVIDLIYDWLAGYRETIADMDPNMIDRQATIVTYEVFKTESNVPASVPLIVKQWIAVHTVRRLIPSLKTYIAKHEKRSDVQDEGYITFYDQLNMLESLEERIEREIIHMQNEVSVALADEYAVGAPRYDRPKTNTGGTFVTEDPFQTGKALFGKSKGRGSWVA